VDEIAARYQAREDRFAAAAARLEQRSWQLSVARLATFLAGCACLLAVLVTAADPHPGWYAGAAAALAVFAGLAVIHERVLRAKGRAGELQALNRQARSRLTRDWSGLPPPPVTPTDDAPTAHDLDLLGPRSLLHLLGTSMTPMGVTTLTRWLLAPAEPDEIRRRQAAVRSLAPELDRRQELEATARELRSEELDITAFLAWSESRPWLTGRIHLVWLTRGLAAAAAVALAAALAGWAPFRVWILLLLVNALFNHVLSRSVRPILARVAVRSRAVAASARLFALVERAPAARQPIADALSASGHTVSQEIARLGRIVELADLRHSSVHGLVDAMVFWDVHVLLRLERWQARCGARVRRWFEAMGEVEALSALAGLHHDHPAWAFPDVSPAHSAIRGRKLAHPLLPPGNAVDNDVEVGPAGTFLLVTGSNMSGKSTLLRAIGTGVVLAQAGGPVCAASLSMPPICLGTSILVEDSLADGVSFFMAELHRLKQVVDAAERTTAEGRTYLYLLDEVLRGTNSVERREAVRRVVGHLVEIGALGVVSTHDLELARLEELSSACQQVHFRETLHPEAEDRVMTFDYRLRPGVATTVNALRLLELVGLDPSTRHAVESSQGPPPDREGHRDRS
jgi:hypothetical protein